ncbi:hypothetical protein EIP91_007200 [Steccherinum ochraceum]|uniref:Uncharacterized protein n=1 Tax=Steccherinum ochraceum TaxID=92696 RepID=A0A4R0R4K5_9APHY|nr:hypothetical protein EIP91_007200 [Steccherinum ochraceum]
MAHSTAFHLDLCPHLLLHQVVSFLYLPFCRKMTNSILRTHRTRTRVNYHYDTWTRAKLRLLEDLNTHQYSPSAPTIQFYYNEGHWQHNMPFELDMIMTPGRETQSYFSQSRFHETTLTTHQVSPSLVAGIEFDAGGLGGSGSRLGTLLRLFSWDVELQARVEAIRYVGHGSLGYTHGSSSANQYLSGSNEWNPSMGLSTLAADLEAVLRAR